MKSTLKRKKPVTADSIAKMAEQGKNVSRFFTNKGRMMGPIQRVNVDFTSLMLEELDERAEELNISRQAVIKTMLRQALDQHYLAARHSPANQKAKSDAWKKLRGAAPDSDLMARFAEFRKKERELEDSQS